MVEGIGLGCLAAGGDDGDGWLRRGSFFDLDFDLAAAVMLLFWKDDTGAPTVSRVCKCVCVGRTKTEKMNPTRKTKEFTELLRLLLLLRLLRLLRRLRSLSPATISLYRPP